MVPNQRFKATWTQWETYHGCPYLFEQLYLDKTVPRQTSEALTKGIRIHDGLEKALQPSPIPTPSGDTPSPRPKSQERRLEIQSAGGEPPMPLPEEVHKSWEVFIKDLSQTPGLDMEVRVENDIAYGKIDVLSPTEFGDWKSGKSRVNDLGKRDQLRFYRWILGPDSAVTHGSLWWVEHPIKRAKLRIPIPYTAVMDRVWRQRITEMWAGDYPKVKSWKCEFCPNLACENNISEEKKNA